MTKRYRAELFRRIQAAGYLRDIDARESFNFPQLTVNNNLVQSMIFQIGALSFIILDLLITADRSVNVQEFGALQVAGEEWDVDWLEQESSIYILYRGHDYPRDTVLNHCIGRMGRIKPGVPMQGFLLGRCQNSVPVELRHSDFPASLAIDNGFEISRHDLCMHFDRGFSRSPSRCKKSLFGPRGSTDEGGSRNEEGQGNETNADDEPSPEVPSSQGERRLASILEMEEMIQPNRFKT